MILLVLFLRRDALQIDSRATTMPGKLEQSAELGLGGAGQRQGSTYMVEAVEARRHRWLGEAVELAAVSSDACHSAATASRCQGGGTVMRRSGMVGIWYPISILPFNS